MSIPPLRRPRPSFTKSLREQNISIRQLAHKLKCEYPVALTASSMSLAKRRSMKSREPSRSLENGSS